MNRSVGVTISAVIIFLGCAAALLGVASIFSVLWFAPIPESQAHFLKYGAYVGGIFLFGLACWGITSGVGLLRLREWARISVLVLSGLLLSISLPGLLVLLVLSFPIPRNIQDPELARQTLLAMRVSLIGYYGVIFALAVFWLVFFNTRSVREQFRGVASAGPHARQGRPRPISITVMGWYFLITGCSFPFYFLLHFPVPIFGFLLKGPTGSLIILTLTFLKIVMGVGLLKLQPWARIAAICYSLYLPLNSLAAFLIPGSHARFEQVQAEFQKMFGVTAQAYTASPNTARLSMWLSLGFTLPMAGVLLWFLFKTKRSFEPSASASAPLT